MNHYSAIYRHRFGTADRAQMRAVWRVIVEESLSRWIPADGHVLDVGAGACHFINNVQAARRVAIDADPDVRNCVDVGVEAVVVPRIAEAEIDGKFDAIFVSNFLEHLDSGASVIECLSMLCRHLKADGRIIILQPNFSLVGARYFDFIDHKTILTDRSLIEAVELAGYRVEYIKRRFLPYTSKSSLPRAPWMVRLYLRLPLAQFFLGQQTLLVARLP